jgi:hypothetical protein
MLAARSNSCANPALADMLARMRSTPGDGGNAIPPDLLNQLAASGNPTFNLLAKHMAQAQAQPKVIDVEPDEVSTVPDPRDEQPDDAGPDPALIELRTHVESMFAELKQLRERMDELAAALGACCVCWGQDHQCRICRGRGNPGFSVPDQALFEELVLPAIRTLRAQTARRASVSPTLQSRSLVEH